MAEVGKKTSSKKSAQPDVAGHIVARNNSRKGDDPSIHAR